MQIRAPSMNCHMMCFEAGEAVCEEGLTLRFAGQTKLCTDQKKNSKETKASIQLRMTMTASTFYCPDQVGIIASDHCH